MSSHSGRSATRTSSDGTDYEVLEPGCSVVYEYVDHAKHSSVSDIGGYTVHNLYVKCQEVKDKLLPINANPREPESSPVVNAMKDTLENEPRRFIRRNNGMTIVCKDIEKIPEEQKIRLNFSNDDEGICNGGHTYFSINTFQGEIPNAGVHIEAIEVPEEVETGNREDEIADIAESRNNINNLQDYTVLDYLGCFDRLKEFMSEESVVSWHEGDSTAIPPEIGAKALIRFVSVVDPLKYQHQILNSSGSTHRNSALGYGDFDDFEKKAHRWRSGSAEYPLKHMGPLIDDILEIKDMLSYSLMHDGDIGTFRRSGLYQDHLRNTERDLHFGRYTGEIGHKINATLEVMMIGMFRSDVYVFFNSSSELVHIGWLIPPEELWNDKKEEILSEMSDYYSSDGNLREFMNNPAPYTIQLYQYDTYASGYPYPGKILYDIDSGKRYDRLESREDATHWLDDDGLVSISETSPEGESALYSET